MIESNPFYNSVLSQEDLINKLKKYNLYKFKYIDYNKGYNDVFDKYPILDLIANKDSDYINKFWDKSKIKLCCGIKDDHIILSSFLVNYFLNCFLKLFPSLKENIEDI
jgi:hypothetical protein